MRRHAAAVTSSTAALKAASFTRDGRAVPLSFRTNWSADARISSSVAGGSKFARVLMFRHIEGLLAVTDRGNDMRLWRHLRVPPTTGRPGPLAYHPVTLSRWGGSKAHGDKNCGAH